MVLRVIFAYIYRCVRRGSDDRQLPSLLRSKPVTFNFKKSLSQHLVLLLGEFLSPHRLNMSAIEEVIEIALQVLFGILGLIFAIAAIHYRDSLCSVLLRRYRENPTQCMEYCDRGNVVRCADMDFRLRTRSWID
jgi:hypothetical protein